MSVVISCLKHLGVGFVYGGFLGEFVFEMSERAFEGTVEEPAHEAEGEDVAALENALVVQPAVGERCLGHGCDGYLYHLRLYAEFLKRIVGSVQGLFEVALAEGVDVHNDYPAGFEEAVVGFESGSVHGNEHVGAVAGGVNSCADAYLKA
ncbi:hypothetical protein IMSAGC008_02109 [Muribaculaceae bacterium]|nr:hypothetical protein IMSAGC008_02109 [Muribaculaceae bacterium]